MYDTEAESRISLKVRLGGRCVTSMVWSRQSSAAPHSKPLRHKLKLLPSGMLLCAVATGCSFKNFDHLQEGNGSEAGTSSNGEAAGSGGSATGGANGGNAIAGAGDSGRRTSSTGGSGSGFGGALPTGGTRTNTGGVNTSSGGAGTGGSSMLAYTLLVDTPKSGTTLSSVVLVSGWATGYLNVEVWDATHQKPPLGRSTPGANGAFSFALDVTSLAAGATQWTIWAWDTPAGSTPTRSTNVLLNLTISH